MTAISVRATDRSTILPAASVRARPRSTLRSRPTNSSPTPRSRLAERSRDIRDLKVFPEKVPDNERTLDLPAAKRLHEMDGAAATDRRSRSFVLHCLSDAAQPELLVDLRRHSFVHAGRADRHRRGAGDALHPACRHGVQFRRAHHARRELRLAVALSALERRLDVLHRGLYPHVPRHLLRLLQGAARGALDPRRHHLSADDGDRLPRLHLALGPDELLGRDRHHQFLLRHSRWSARPWSPGCGAASRSAIRRCSASSRCITCCRS